MTAGTETLGRVVVPGRALDAHPLLETMLFSPGDGFRNVGGHLDRLERSARDLGYQFSRDDTVKELRTFACVNLRPRRVRLTLSVDGEISVVGTHPPAAVEPVSLTIDYVPVDAHEASLRHKTTNRGRYEACRARHPAYDDVVMVNQYGHVTETTIANIVVDIDGVWVTPPAASGCLPGVERAVLLASGAVCERIVTTAELAQARALRVVSSLRGVLKAQLSA